MSKRLNWVPVVLATLALVFAAPQAESEPPGPGAQAGPAAEPAHSLLDVALNLDEQGHPEVTLLTDGEVTFQSQVLEGPDRLVLDLDGVVNRLDAEPLDVAQGGLSRIRTSQFRDEPAAVSRVVFDLDQPLPFSISQSGSTIRVSFGAPGGTPAQPLRADRERSSSDSVLDLIQELEAREPSSVADQPAPPPARGDSPSQVAAEPRRSSRAVEPEVIDRLLSQPAFAAPQVAASYGRAPESFETKTIFTDEIVYTGKRISLNLVDADIKQVFRLFHEISGLNFVLDPGVQGRVTIVLDQVPWDQALDIILKNNSLDKVLENNVLRIAATQKLAEEAASRRQLRDAQELEVEPVTLTRTLSYAKAREVERVIQNGGILSARGSVIVDERTNTLIISDVPKKVEPVDSLISTLDAETPQVMIEARIVETSRQYVRDFGVQWGFSALANASRGTATNLNFPHNISAQYGLNLPGGGAASTLAFSLSNIVDSFTLDLALSALETEGHGRILSSPKVATQNNERAEIEQGVRIPIVNTTATEINVEFVSASLRMNVTPQITAEGTIILDVEVENNSPDFVNTSGDVPSIRTQRAQTKVLINDGGTTVIGGIFVVNEGQSEVGVPWFRKLPVFGWLFKAQNITKENRELLIFITPKIVRLS